MSPGAVLLDLHGTWTPQDRAERQCRRVEVDVPPGVDGIHVALRFDRSVGAVLDLGCEGPSGYVGWSGARGSTSWSPRRGRRRGTCRPRRSPAGGPCWSACTGSRHRGRLPPARHCAVGGAGRVRAGPIRSAGAGWRQPAAASSPPRGGRDALAGRGPPRPHGALRWRPDRRPARRARGIAGTRLPRGHRPQHDQPPRRAGRRGQTTRHTAAARAGGDHRHGTRECLRGHRLRRLP